MLLPYPDPDGDVGLGVTLEEIGALAVLGILGQQSLFYYVLQRLGHCL